LCSTAVARPWQSFLSYGSRLEPPRHPRLCSSWLLEPKSGIVKRCSRPDSPCAAVQVAPSLSLLSQSSLFVLSRRSRYNAAAVKSVPLSSRAPARRLYGAPGVRLASSSLPSISEGRICGAWPSMERCCPVVPMNTQRDPLGPGAGGPAGCQAPCARAADLFAGTDLAQTTSVAESSARLCISGQAWTPPAGAT
jgi:hypothetical protein